jgi:pimeloyl-ACP methyl ester carboxylesterase
MAELSPHDSELLAQDLPELAQVAVASPIYPGQRGQMEYRAAGDASNPVVLMLHGLGSSSAGYRAQFAGLSREFRVIAWNAPGFGNSSLLTGHHADDYADALAAFLRALRVERLSVLVGSSWGTVLAVPFARRYPALVSSLVLSAPNVGKGRVLGEARDAELDAWLRTADVNIPVSPAANADRLLTPHSPSAVRQRVERLRDSMTTDGWRQAIRSLYTVYTPDLITEIRCPITILSGSLDKVAPHGDHAERLVAVAPWAKSISFEDCGHMLKLEAPSRFNAIVRAAALQPESPAHPNDGTVGDKTGKTQTS